MRILELNQVLIEGERQTLSFAGEVGEVTTLTGGSPQSLTNCLLAIMGFATILNGHVSIDGEPINQHSARYFRKQMAYAPSRLSRIGEVNPYEPPTVQDVFGLRVNRDQPISNGILSEEIRRVGSDSQDERTQLIAVASLLDKPIILIDNPPVEAMSYLHQQAAKGKIVLLTSNERIVLAQSDKTVEI